MALLRRKREVAPRVKAVQLRRGEGHPFQMLEGYIPLHRPEFSLYRSIREAVPLIDAAILKLVRLSGGITVSCRDRQGERELQQFFKTVKVGWNQQGIQAFLDCYIDSLLTCGRAVGEMVMEPGQGEIAAVLCGDVSDVEVKENGSPLDFVLGLRKDGWAGGSAALSGSLAFYPLSAQPNGTLWGFASACELPFRLFSGSETEALRCRRFRTTFPVVALPYCFVRVTQRAR